MYEDFFTTLGSIQTCGLCNYYGEFVIVKSFTINLDDLTLDLESKTP